MQTGWVGMDTQLSPARGARLAWLLLTVFREMLKHRNEATAPGGHLPQRSKGKTSINQHVSTAVPIHKGAEIRLWVLGNCFMFEERKGNLWDVVLEAP